MSERPRVTEELSRDLGLFQVTMMGLGMMIGAGVFIGIGISMGVAGPGGTVLTFALNGLIALFTAMSFAELSSALPRAGGAYNFARVAFGRGPSFLAGWMEWFASSVAGSLYAVVFAGYTSKFVSEAILGLELSDRSLFFVTKAVAIAIGIVFVYINYRGASETGKIGAFFTVGQMAFVLSIAAIGFVRTAIEPSRLANFTPFMPEGWSALLVTMGFTYVAFEGFEVIAQAGDETVNPKRNMPKAMIYSVLIVTLTYVLVASATVVAVRSGPDGVAPEAWRWIGSQGPTGDGEHGFGAAVGRLVPFGGALVTLAVIFSSTSALNATIYSATRASYALGRDRLLPAMFSKVSKKRRTPWVALAFTSVIVLTVAGLLPVKHVGSCASMMFLLLFFLVNACAIRVRIHMGDELTYGFLMPLFPLFPLLAIGCQGVLAAHLLHMSWIAWAIAPAWIAAGALVYRAYSRRHAIATEEEIHVIEEEASSIGEGYKVMVGVANPENALQLVRTTYKLCTAKNARVELIHMAPVPDQIPLSDAPNQLTPGREAIVETMLYLSNVFPVSTTIRYCRNAARGILTAIREKNVNLLILGWLGRPLGRTFALGSTIDPVIERSPCNVVIVKDGGDRKFRRILVPLRGGPNSSFALEIASILAERPEAVVTAFTVNAGHRDFDLDKFVAKAQEQTDLQGMSLGTKTVKSNNVVEAILKEAESYDLVVLGYTGDPVLRKIGRESLPETIAKRCPTPVAIVKQSSGIRSFIRRWI